MKLKLNIQRFASTNKTANYNLSQYVGSDKPTYLGDYNSDMNKIDTQMKANSAAISEVSTKADLAKTTADTALQNANLAQTTANEANTTATSALQKAVTNEANINKFNLDSIDTFTQANFTASESAISVNSAILNVAYDNDSSIAKIYGVVDFTVGSGATANNYASVQTNLRPKEKLIVTPIGEKVMYRRDNNSLSDIFTLSIEIETTGELKVHLSVPESYNIGRVSCHIYPCLLFLKDFGDTIQK